MSISWFVSTIVLTALGFYMWPHTFASAFSAKMKKYFVKCGHYATVLFSFTFRVLCRVRSYLASSWIKGRDVDLSLFRLALQTFDPWFIGVIGSAGVLTALVPGSMLVMAASTLLAKIFTEQWSHLPRIDKWQK